MQNTETVKGVSLSGLQANGQGEVNQPLEATEAEIKAAKDNFGATHIRLQIQQQALVGEDGTRYHEFYARNVFDAIDYALNLDLTVVINCQTEPGPTPRTYLMPNQGNDATSKFWEIMLTPAGGNYSGNPSIICDLFNEPQCGPNWSLWQAHYQGLINHIRGDLRVTANQLWADADNYAASLENCPGLTDPADNLVYSFHHPNSGPGGDSAGWDADFGNWAAAHRVVNGEFAQHITGFNWGSAYEIQRYLDYCSAKSIGHTIWTVGLDPDYFTDSNRMPYGWWGHMIDNLWNPGNHWKTYCFRSSVKWSQNYLVPKGERLPWTNGLYQGFSTEETSMLAGVAGFNSFTADMAGGKQYRIHVSFQCVHANYVTVTAVVGAHGVSSAPSTWGGVTPYQPGVVEKADLEDGWWCNVDIPPEYHQDFASGHYKGIVFGPGPNPDPLSHVDPVYQGHMSFSPQVIIEVHP